MEVGTTAKKTIAPKKITLVLKAEYKEGVASQSVRRGGTRITIPISEIKANPVRAIYEYKLEYMFKNSKEELTEVIRRVDEKKGLTKVDGYKTRPLRAIESLGSDYDVL